MSEQNDYIAVAFKDEGIKVFDLATKKQIASLDQGASKLICLLICSFNQIL